MCDDEKALRRNIIANPDDNLPRLVFADWLEERGRKVPCPVCLGCGTVSDGCECFLCLSSGRVDCEFTRRAAFIRVQCELAEMKPPRVIRPNSVVIDGIVDGVRYVTIRVTDSHRYIDAKFGDKFDIEVITSRVSADWHRDMELCGWTPTTSHADILFKESTPWSQRDRYDYLLGQQHSLMICGAPSQWYDWVFCAEKDEDGDPIAPKNGRWGCIVHPSYNEQFPSVQVPPRIKQKFRCGFVSEIECGMDEWMEYGPSILNEHPILKVVITDKHPTLFNGRWTYYTVGDPTVAADFVPRVMASKSDNGTFYYDTAEVARDWLSRRCIEWAKSQSGVLA